MAGLGVFGALLIVFAALTKNGSLRNAGAALLLIGFLVLTWV